MKGLALMRGLVVLGGLGLGSLAVFGIASAAVATTAPNHGAFYLTKMQQALTTVMTQQQAHINQGLNGGSKSDRLKPDVFVSQVMARFQQSASASVMVTGEHRPEIIAPAIVELLQIARDIIANLQRVINTDADGSVKLKGFIPAIFGSKVIEEFELLTGVAMKQTTLGREGFSARNPYNRPIDWEREALERFRAPDWNINQGYGVFATGAYRYVKPMYIKESCIVCHGSPIGHPGPYGHPKEGYQIGDIRGGISVAIPTVR